MSVQELVTTITTKVFNPLIILLFAIATLVFAWGVALYIIGSYGSDSRIERAKSIMFLGLIGMFIMASAWGIVGLFCDFFSKYGKVC